MSNHVYENCYQLPLKLIVICRKQIVAAIKVNNEHFCVFELSIY